MSLAVALLFAYAPATTTLVQRMAWAQAQENPKRLAVRAGALQIGLAYPGRCIVRRGAEVAQKNELGLTTNTGAADLNTLATWACELLALRKAEQAEAEAILSRFLEKNGVDPLTVSLGRIAGRVAYVIGAAPGQLDRPQLWVDRDSYAPLRLLARDGDAMVDVQLTRYMPSGLGYTFPRELRILRSGAEVVFLRADAIAPDPKDEEFPAGP
jgi:hypothetical protein